MKLRLPTRPMQNCRSICLRDLMLHLLARHGWLQLRNFTLSATIDAKSRAALRYDHLHLKSFPLTHTHTPVSDATLLTFCSQMGRKSFTYIHYSQYLINSVWVYNFTPAFQKKRYRSLPENHLVPAAKKKCRFGNDLICLTSNHKRLRISLPFVLYGGGGGRSTKFEYRKMK